MASPDHDESLVTVRGVQVPQLGLGTWQITGSDCIDAVLDALEIGYRHIDTARAYGNEHDVGAALAASGVPREEVFLTTKVWMDDFEPGRLVQAAESSLRELDTDYVDLLLLHWPNPDVALEASLDAMTGLHDRGLIRQLGVSNFPAPLLRRALEVAPVFCDQVEFHPLLGQPALLEIARDHDVMITAYAPLAHGKVFDEPVLADIASRHGCGVAEVALRWLLDHEQVSAVPKAASHRNRLANFAALDLNLSPEDRSLIDQLPKDRRQFDPPWAPTWEN